MASGHLESLNLSILWVAIKRHAEATGLIDGTDEDGRVQLREFGLNWKEISNIAVDIEDTIIIQRK